VVLLLLALVATLVTVATGAANAAKPPPNPSDQQISAAQREKAALGAEVGRLSAQVVSMQNQLNQLQAAQEMAEQKLADALAKLEAAKQQSAAAAAAVAKAQGRVRQAQREYQAYVQAAYMSGSVGGTTGSLLTADDPNVLLEQSALQSYEADHQLDAIGNLKRATVAKSNADAAARLAVKRQHDATNAAAAAKQAADQAVISAQAQEKQLQNSLATQQSALDQARDKLATLNHERAKYIAWKKRQEAIRRARERARRLAEARARAAAARAAAAAAAAAALHHGGGGGGGGFSSPAPRPAGGGWTPARGIEAAHRAEQYLGWMYAWAGGNASGPTFGVCAGDGAFNDCHIRGFDCSGLSIYAWAPYRSMAHYAATQYWQAGSFHPSLGNLRPGDLLFWSSNGTVGGIHHVAIYVGGGNVIQAPQSGSVIQITPVGAVSWGYFGATRPLT
jgi:cell wall-associated NlpC family hydrolase